jgi:hypothetical protein
LNLVFCFIFRVLRGYSAPILGKQTGADFDKLAKTNASGDENQPSPAIEPPSGGKRLRFRSDGSLYG